jgi:hypothetical protein
VGEVGLGHTPLGMHQGILELRIFDFLIRDRGDHPTLQKYEGLEQSAFHYCLPDYVRELLGIRQYHATNILFIDIIISKHLALDGTIFNFLVVPVNRLQYLYHALYQGGGKYETLQLLIDGQLAVGLVILRETEKLQKRDVEVEGLEDCPILTSLYEVIPFLLQLLRL